MKRIALLALLAFRLSAQIAPSFGEPSLAPDGTIAFVSGGDIWTVSSSGGDARLLVSNPATESRPIWSPDGKQLAFVSTRTGNGDIYVLDLASGATRRITADDVLDVLDGWSRDGKWLYFNSASRDIAAMRDIWRVSTSGGTPMQVSAERYVNEFFSAPSPDGNRLAFTARGVAAAQWWRHRGTHIDQSQIWILENVGQAILPVREGGEAGLPIRDGQAGLPVLHYTPVTADGARELWPMWSADGKQLWYVSNRDGNENIWTTAIGGQPRKVTSFSSGRVLWPSIAYDGGTIVFERDFAIWKLDTATGNASEVKITRIGQPSMTALDHRKLNDRFTGFALSPDGKKVAFIARGDVWAASAKEGGDAFRITNTGAAESQLAWSPDSKTLVYASDRGGRDHLYQYDVAAERETELTSGDTNDHTPRFSPDGKSLAFARGRGEIAILDLATKQVRTLAKGLLDRPPLGSDRPFDWSPDNKWLAYLAYAPGTNFRNAYVIKIPSPAAAGEGGRERSDGPGEGTLSGAPVSFLANTSTDSVSWSRDGRYLLLSTGQRTEKGQIARVDLLPHTPKFREDQFRDLFQAKPAEEKKSADAPAEKKTPEVAIEFNGARQRMSLLATGLDAGESTISPDGKWLALTASTGDDVNVFVYSLDELSDDPAIPRQLSATSGRKSNLHFSADSKEVWYLDGGKIASATIDPVKTKTLAVTAETDVDFVRERDEAFHQVWTWLRDNFFDPSMHGVDWNALRDQYAPRVAAAASPDDFRRLMNLMIGELNASHTGANPPRGSQPTITGRLGVRFDRQTYEENGTLKVSEVIPLSPADVAKIKVGDVILAVNRTPTAGANFDQLLEYRIGKRTVITIAPNRDVVVQPISNADEKQLTYRAWVEASRDYVDRVSNHRLGYVHMYDMSEGSLNQLFLDLDAENRTREGVVIDVRNNNGGFVNAYAIDILARRPYLTMTFRDFPPAPARSILGQRALEKPTVLVTNRHSLSDAEDFTEGYRTLGLGKVVGEPTAGWIIYTSDVPLIEGTLLRLPFIRITDAKGEDMELHPRPVDVFAQRALGEWAAGRDSQLDVAVETLLKDLKK
jgi:tricorn protease